MKLFYFMLPLVALVSSFLKAAVESSRPSSVLLNPITCAITEDFFKVVTRMQLPQSWPRGRTSSPR